MKSNHVKRLYVWPAVLLSLLAACIPQAGQGVSRYLAEPEEIISAIADIAPTLQAAYDHDFYSVESVSDRSIVLTAGLQQSLSLLLGQTRRRITFTVSRNQGITLLAVNGSQGTNAGIEQILRELSRRFEEVRQ